MRRILISVLSAIFALGAFAAFVWYFAYRLDPSPPRTATVLNLTQPAEVNWIPDGAVSITAHDTLDAVAAIGYASLTRNPWATLLLRQAALGKLGEWFGKDALELDIATRMLLISRDAERDYASLDARSKSVLAAYAEGVNAAMNDNALRNSNLVLLQIDDVDEWAPWHSIAIERLFAWLATSIEREPATDSTPLPLDLTRLIDATDKLKAWLSVDGLENSAAWAIRRNDVTQMFDRIVYGSSIESYFHEFSLEINDSEAFACMALTGTPYLISGRSTAVSWVVLPHQKATVRSEGRMPTSTERSRLRFGDGSEQLIEFQMSDGRLVFPVDSVSSVALSWPGLSHPTDASAWIALLDGREPDFKLLDGTRLAVQRSGAWTVAGPPSAIRRINSGVYVSHSRWARFPAERLAAWMENENAVDAGLLKQDTFSPWATRLLPQLLLIVSRTDENPEYEEAIDYLRNWDGSFNESSIAASIFDAWAVRMWLSTGVMPGMFTGAALDTSYVLSSFHATVDRLRSDFGTDASTWRWERVQRNERDWPMWLMMMRRSATMATTRYAPIRTAGSGHPSALRWGATSYNGRGSPPGRWESWISTDTWLWTYASDTRLDPSANFRRSDALLNTVATGQFPVAVDEQRVLRTSLVPRQR